MIGADDLRDRVQAAQQAHKRHVRLTVREAQDFAAMMDAVAGLADQAREALAPSGEA